MIKFYNKNAILNLFCILIFCISVKTIAQTANDPSKFVPNIIPPSPIAYELGKYGNVPVGMFTGSPNINIPIYSYKTANLEVPINMFYASNGVKVDEISTNVGQSWNLNFGGVITRITRDKPDEERGEYPIPMTMADSLAINSPQALSFFQYIGENDVDSESDLYSFNFGKYSGKFIFDNNHGITLMPAQDFKIECKPADDIFNFIITTPDGIKYYFNDKEITSQRVIGGGHSVPTIAISSWYLSKIVHPKGDEIQYTYDDVSFSYIASKSQTFKVPYPHIQYNVYGELQDPSGDLSAIYDNTLTISGKAIKSIKSTNTSYGKVVFNYSLNSSPDVTFGNNKLSQIIVLDKKNSEIEKMDFIYSTTPNNRVFLDKIQYKDLNKNYQFDYFNKDNFPPRLSFSQDHWGYYNGQVNTSIVPKNIVGYNLENTVYNGADKEPDGNFAKIGMLRKVVYPTKGYTELDYESNDYYGEKKIYPVKVYKSLEVSTPEDLLSSSTECTISVQTQQNIEIFGSISFSCTDPLLNIGKNKANYNVLNTTTGVYEHLYSYSVGGELIDGGTFLEMTPNMHASNRKHFFTAKPNQTYKIFLEAKWSCTSAKLNFNYYSDPVTTIQTNIITGGLRVKQTKDYSINTPIPIVKKYFYAKKNELSKSSGDKGQTPYYIDFTKNEILRDDGGPYYLIDSFTYLNLSSSSIVSLFDTGSSNVFYKYVTISNGEDLFSDGGEEHEFVVHRDGWGRTVLGNYDIKSAPFTNFGWDNGLEKKISLFNKNLTSVKEIINYYDQKTDIEKESTSYSSRKHYDLVLGGSVIYSCTPEDLTRIYSYRYCTTNHKHCSGGSLVNNLSKKVKRDFDCIASGANNVTIYYNHACYGLTLPATVTYSSNIDNISVVAYKNISYWHYLKSKDEIEYDINGQNPIITSTVYNYDSLAHLQLTSQRTQSSLGQPLETKYYYPPDLLASGLQTTEMQKLTDQNSIDKPVKTEIFVNNVKTKETITKYEESAITGNLVLPTEIHEIKGLENIDITSNANRKILFTLYDIDIVGESSKGNGNILEYKLESGIPVSIIWGYNKTQPIAKIENATYNEVSSYVANLQTISDTGTEANLLSALATLRNDLPNAMVTTYTYKPLIGISSINDPRGNTTYYEYDEFNRLKLVRDSQGNILSENQYHYKN